MIIDLARRARASASPGRSLRCCSGSSPAHRTAPGSPGPRPARRRLRRHSAPGPPPDAHRIAPASTPCPGQFRTRSRPSRWSTARRSRIRSGTGCCRGRIGLSRSKSRIVLRRLGGGTCKERWDELGLGASLRAGHKSLFRLAQKTFGGKIAEAPLGAASPALAKGNLMLGDAMATNAAGSAVLRIRVRKCMGRPAIIGRDARFHPAAIANILQSSQAAPRVIRPRGRAGEPSQVTDVTG